MKSIYRVNNEKDALLKIIPMSILISCSIFLLLPLFNTIKIINQPQQKKYNIVHFERKVKKQEIKEKKTDTFKTKAKPRMINVKKKISPLKLESKIPAGPVFDKDFLQLTAGFESELNIEIPVWNVDEVDKAPTPVIAMPPQYPIMARNNSIEGEVVVLAVVDEKGKVESVEILESYPGEVFVNTSLNCIKNWVFKPAEKNGKTVKVKVEIPLKYKLH
ncbi:MAG: TonB family protein [Candidatus Muirbacterium halophilum]|nr:TonB family protein [Candidatus Muirbacterium halophilum]MCK9475900.1 TonB family protein [Candidatus Muirbacterium halophilum]